MTPYECVILDGDWGCDELQAAAIAAHCFPDVPLIATTVFGNVDVDTITENAKRILGFLGLHEVAVHRGAEKPTDGPPPPKDGAHGSDGIGGVVLPPPNRPTSPEPAVDAILREVGARDAGSVAILACGPLTNLAAAISRDLVTMSKVATIVAMGGCMLDLPAADRPSRRGNITEHAEFNVFTAPEDAHSVLQTDLPVVLLPMNCTQQLTFSEDRAARLRGALGDQPTTDIIIRLLSAPTWIDRLKFGAPPFMHDVHTALYLADPGMYTTGRGAVHVTGTGVPTTGRTVFRENSAGTTVVARDLVDIDQAFGVVVDALAALLGPPQVL